MLISDSVLTTADFPAVPAKTPPMATSPPTSVPLNVPRLPPYALSTEQSTVTVWRYRTIEVRRGWAVLRLKAVAEIYPNPHIAA